MKMVKVKAAELTKHIPKGGLCRTCKHKARDCSGLAFDQMRVIKTYSDGVKAVKCAEHLK